VHLVGFIIRIYIVLFAIFFFWAKCPVCYKTVKINKLKAKHINLLTMSDYLKNKLLLERFQSGRLFSRSTSKTKLNMQHWWNDTDRGKTKYLRKKSERVPLCPPKTSHRMASVLTQAAAVTFTWIIINKTSHVCINVKPRRVRVTTFAVKEK